MVLVPNLTLYRSNADKVALAVHAILSSNALRLLAVGPAADCADAQALWDAQDEAALDGWNASDSFSFLYAVPVAKDSAAGESIAEAQHWHWYAADRCFVSMHAVCAALPYRGCSYPAGQGVGAGGEVPCPQLLHLIRVHDIFFKNSTAGSAKTRR